MFKLIYKPFLKKGDLAYRDRKQKNALKTKLLEKRILINSKLLQDSRNAFFIANFLPIMSRHGRFNIDIIMDICHEIPIYTNPRTKIQTTPETNWTTQKKMKAMKKISKAFRYLVSECRSFKAKFVKYLNDSESRRGLAKSHSKTIVDKIKKKIQAWKKIDRDNNHDPVKFLEILQKECKNAKFKFPWSLRGMLNGIKITRADLQS